MKSIKLHVPAQSLDLFKRSAIEYNVTIKLEQPLDNGFIAILIEIVDPYELFLMGSLTQINQQLDETDKPVTN